MKRIVFSISVLIVSMVCFAQEQTSGHSRGNNPQSSILSLGSSIGYLNYDSVLHAMPQYAAVQQHMQQLRQSYEREMKRVEDEFNQKYERFLEERSQYPRTILLKRQQELQDMMQRNVDFRTQARSELQQAEQQAYNPLRRQLREAVAAVARSLHLAVVLNTDGDNTLYIDPILSVDITSQVLQQIGN